MIRVYPFFSVQRRRRPQHFNQARLLQLLLNFPGVDPSSSNRLALGSASIVLQEPSDHRVSPGSVVCEPFGVSCFRGAGPGIPAATTRNAKKRHVSVSTCAAGPSLGENGGLLLFLVHTHYYGTHAYNSSTTPRSHPKSSLGEGVRLFRLVFANLIQQETSSAKPGGSAGDMLIFMVGSDHTEPLLLLFQVVPLLFL